MRPVKIISVLILTVITLTSYAQKKGYDLNWYSDFEQAKALASKDNKLVLIYFTSSDASTASKRLNEDFFYTEKFKKLADAHLVLVRVNTPRRANLISNHQKTSNDKLRNSYGQKVIPTVVLCDATGKQLGIIESYNYLRDTSKHYNLIYNALNR